MKIIHFNVIYSIPSEFAPSKIKSYFKTVNNIR